MCDETYIKTSFICEKHIKNHKVSYPTIITLIIMPLVANVIVVMTINRRSWAMSYQNRMII